ncbi:MAG: tetratricopeptide repeat protein, partial [candidate division KSB1 bacterium]|nr:tetratricopeptide repeat protein [candidate division KSB1 bacterium]
MEADHLERNGELEKAEQLLTRHLKAHPEDAAAHFHLGELHARMQHFEGMLQDFAKAEQSDSRWREKVAMSKEYHWRENLNRGITALHRHEPQQAMMPLRRAILIFPKRYAPYPLLAAALIATSDSSGATAMLEKACVLEENDLESRHALLQIYYASGRYEPAL